MEAAKKLNMRVQLSPAPGQRSEVGPGENSDTRRSSASTSNRPQSSRSSSGNRRQKARAPTAPVQQLRQESRPQSRAGSGSRGAETARVKERIVGPLMSMHTKSKPGSPVEDPTVQGLDSPVKLRQVTATGPMVLVRPKSGYGEPKSPGSKSPKTPSHETEPKPIVPKNPFGGVVVVAEDSTTEEDEEDDLAVRERPVAPTQMWSRRRSYAASVQQGWNTIGA